jgi:hypothetical protein
MKNTILALAFAVALQPGIAQVVQQNSSQRTEQNSSTTVNPDGTVVRRAETAQQKTDSVTNPDGSSSTVQTHERNTRVHEKTNVPAGSTTTEHHSSSSTTTTTTSPR